MRVFFLVPPGTYILNRDFASSHVAPPLGLASIISAIENNPETEISFMDACAEGVSLNAAVRRIADFHPDVLAITAITTQIHDAAAAAAAVKRAIPGVKVITGGPHTSKIPAETLAEFPVFDFTAAGEGETIMKDFLAALAGGGNATGVPGVFALQGGVPANGGARDFIEDLDSLPFPQWKHIRWERYRAFLRLRRGGVRETPVSTSRGCPFNCVFCAKFLGNRVRERSVESVAGEISRNAREHSVRQVFFTDETFTFNRERTLALCAELERSGLYRDVSWVCVTRPDMLDSEMLSAMKSSGCFAVCIGADSTLDKNLKFMNKKSAVEDIRRAVRLCQKYGILTEATYILGLPGDTADSIKKDIRGAVAVGSDMATFSILVPYPGTKIMEMAENGGQGLVLLTRDWRLYGKQLGCAMETENLKRPALEKLQREAYTRFYLRPRNFLKVFRMADPKIIMLYAAAHLLRRAGLLRPVKPRPAK